MRTSGLSITPENIRQGDQITLQFSGDIQASHVKVKPELRLNLGSFTVPLSRESGNPVAYLSLNTVGSYQVEVEGISETLNVQPQTNLTFGQEFGLTAGLVTLFFMGFILWAKKTRNKG